jgi:hypothetical protein
MAELRKQPLKSGPQSRRRLGEGAPVAHPAHGHDPGRPGIPKLDMAQAGQQAAQLGDTRLRQSDPGDLDGDLLAVGRLRGLHHVEDALDRVLIGNPGLQAVLRRAVVAQVVQKVIGKIGHQTFVIQGGHGANDP